MDDPEMLPEQPAGPRIHHAPLRRWSPVSVDEGRQARRFLADLLVFPYFTVGTVAFLCWCYAVQLFLGWPMAWLFPNPADLVDQLFILRLGECLGWLNSSAVLQDGEYWRLISCTLLHGSNLHVLGNCFMLYLFGRNVENGIGRAAFLVTYVGAGVLGALMSMALVGQESLGASGAVLGMLGASLSFGRRYRLHIPKLLRDYFGLDMWVIVLLVGLVSLLPGIDWAGHLGGFLWGFLVGAVWPARLFSSEANGAGRALRGLLVTAALGCVLATLGVMGQRALEVQEYLPDDELRALRYAITAEEMEQQLEIAARLAASYPEHARVQMIHAAVLVTAERWDDAATKMLEVEEEWPDFVEFEPYFDNDLAWSLFMGRPKDPQAVAEGLKRVRRNLARERGSHAMQNTLAYGLYLDGQFAQAQQVLAAAMTAASREDRANDVFLDVLIRLALKKPRAALARYQEAVLAYPEGEFRAAAEAELTEMGLLQVGSSEADEGPP